MIENAKIVNTFSRIWCCNPFGLEKQKGRESRSKITERRAKKISNLVVGEAICDLCRLKISKRLNTDLSDSTETDSEVKKSSEEEYVAPGVAEEATISNVNV